MTTALCTHVADLSAAACPICSAHDTTCGHCGRTWSSVETPTPSARCPFEYDHEYDDDPYTKGYLTPDEADALGYEDDGTMSTIIHDHDSPFEDLRSAAREYRNSTTDADRIGFADTMAAVVLDELPDVDTAECENCGHAIEADDANGHVHAHDGFAGCSTADAEDRELYATPRTGDDPLPDVDTESDDDRTPEELRAALGVALANGNHLEAWIVVDAIVQGVARAAHESALALGPDRVAEAVQRDALAHYSDNYERAL